MGKYELKTTKPNKYLTQYTFDDVKLIGDSQYVLKGSERQYTHMATVMFRGEHFVLFCETDRLLEWGNRQRLGDVNFGFLKDDGFLKPKTYIEKVRFMPKAHDTIQTWLEFISDEELFYFLLEYFKMQGILKNLEIKGR